MAGTYQHTPVRQAFDKTIAWLTRQGAAPKGIWELTVRGRSTGEPRTLPVTPLLMDGRRYLVAPYGEVSWVRNLRASGTGTLRRGSRAEPFRAEELDTRRAAPALKLYVQRTPVVRPYIAAGPDDSVEDFEAIATLHPVFHIRPA